MRRSAVANAEADRDVDLEVRHLAVDDIAAGLDHLEPVHVAHALGSFGQCVGYGIIDADTG